MTVADFLILYPEFEGEDEILIQTQLDNASLDVPESVWGKRAAAGLAALAAHHISMRKQNILTEGLNRSDVIVAKADGIAVEYKGKYADTAIQSPFEKTDYGQEYLRLERIVSYTVPRQTIGVM